MFKNISKSIIVLGIIFTLVLGLSYGTFIYTSDSYRATEMLVSNLSYGIDITASDATANGKTVNVPSGNTSIALLKVTSLNKIDTKYGVDYKITKGTGTVKYASNTGWLPTGKISENNVGTYEKVIKVVISATTDVTVDFTVTGGFPNNELTEVASGYTRITEKADNVISYNDTLTNVVKKETTNNIYGGESTNNYAQYPINEDNTKNIWRILGTYNGIGTKIVSNQVSTTTKSTLSTDLTSFYNTLEKPDNYILATDKFACTNTSCTSSSYSKVGLISTSEYEMLGGINSYLASSESYFALDNGTIKNITSGGIEETSTTSSLRPAVYLQDYVTVTGSGTVSDPFKLKMPEYAVVLNVVNGSAALPSKMITRGENATYEITPNTGYKLVLSSNTCSNGTLSGNIFTISNVTSAQSCTITLTPESYTLTLDANGGSVSTTSKTVTYDSTYGELPTPTRTGYTFNGWYGPNIMPYGDFSNTNTNIWKPNQNVTVSQGNGYYQVIYNQTDSTPGLIWESTESLNLLELNKTYTLSMKVKGINTSRIQLSVYNSFTSAFNISQSEFTVVQTTFSLASKERIFILLYEALPTLNSGFQIEWLKIEEGNVATPFKATSSTKVTTPSDHKLVANWTANTYSVTFNPNGGSVSTTTKNVTYGSTYGDLPTPTRTGYTFNGWYNKIYSNTFSLNSLNDAWNYTSVVSSGLKPGVTYWINIDKAELTSGTATEFTTLLYDFTSSKDLYRIENSFGTNVNYEIPVPSNIDTSHDIRILVYSGYAGNTNNNATKYTNYSIYGTNKTTNTKYTSTSVVETPANQELIASWTQNTYSVTLNVTNGTGSSTKTVAYGNSATFTGISPNSGYSSSNPTVSCTGGTLSGTTLTVKNVTSARTCTVTFNKMTLSDKLLADKSTRPGARANFGETLTTANTKTLYTSTEDSKTVYYFAGNATDNWVKFGKNASNQDLYWRIIRTNSDGSVRLLYHGTSTTATDAYIGTSAFNSSRDNIAYVSYMYGSLGSIPNARTNQTNSSTIKTIIDNWYTSNLEAKGYTKYLSTTAVYCNDRTYTVSDYTYFGAYTRLINNKTPKYDCEATEDKFTVDTSTGNGKLTYPIALMTADEISFAGGLWATDAPTWYYYNSANGSSTNSTWWWLLSPSYWNGRGASVFFVYGSSDPGSLNYNNYVYNSYGVRPAISLKSCVKTSGGDGSASAPYTIKETTSGC